MAKFQEKPIVVDAYVIKSIGPQDNEGNYVPDENGDLTVQASDAGSAGTIPYVFAASALTDVSVGDYVVVAADGTQSIIGNTTFLNAYIAL